MASAYRQPPPGRVCLVLGGGNASSIGPLDVLHKLFVELQVVVLKMHPVMAHLDEVQAAALAPLVRAGVLRIVHGGAAEGGHLANHPGVDTLHITGADRTYEAIVYGTGREGADRKHRDDPVLHKPFTAELGNLTPIIVVPGRWSPSDLDYHAENIVTMLTNNAGFNCTTSRVIVTAAGWAQRTALMDRIRARLAALPTRLAYYPGARERFAAFGEVHPEAERFGDAGEGHLPWMLIPDLSPDAVGDPCYRVEAFCSVTAETTIDAADAPAFLERAVRFANETLWGTLNATLIVDPRTAKDPGTHRARAGGRGPAVRDGLPEPLVGDRVRPGDHAVGRVPRPCPHGHRVRNGLRPQPADVRAGGEDRGPIALPGVAEADLVRQPQDRPPGRAAPRPLRGRPPPGPPRPDHVVRAPGLHVTRQRDGPGSGSYTSGSSPVSPGWGRRVEASLPATTADRCSVGCYRALHGAPPRTSPRRSPAPRWRCTGSDGSATGTPGTSRRASRRPGPRAGSGTSCCSWSTPRS